MLRTTTMMAGAVALTLTGCSSIESGLGPSEETPSGRPAENLDEPLLRAARADQQRVLAICLAVLRSHPRLAEDLEPVISHHRLHVRTLGGTTADTPRRRTAPRKPVAAVALLAETESTAAADRAKDAMEAVSGDFARVLGAISASQAQHAVLLRAVVAARGNGAAP